MSAEQDLARLVIRKRQLDVELRGVRAEVKKRARTVKLPFAVEVDGNAVMVKKPQYPEGMPLVEVVPLLGAGR